MSLTETLQAHWGQRLRETRTTKGMTIGDLARAAQIDRANLSRIERGLVNSGDEARIRLAAALSVKVEEIWAYPVAAQETQ